MKLKLVTNKIVLLLLQFAIANGWTATYKQPVKNIKDESVSFSKQITIPFTQLLVYWNGKKPAQGYWQISARIKDSKTKKWSKKIVLMDWGKNRNHSYSDTTLKNIKNHHVRLEVENNQKAAGFMITITAKNGAKLSDLDLIGATISDFSKFESENFQKYQNTKSIKLNLPKISQIETEHKDAHRICSPTSLAMVLGYLSQKKIDAGTTADKVYDSSLDAYGAWQYNIAHASEILRHKYSVHLKRLAFFQDILDNLKVGLPVIVSVRGEIRGAPKAYNNGHLMVIIGYNSQTKQVICHDPAWQQDNEVLQYYPLKDFLSAWDRSYRLAYCFERK